MRHLEDHLATVTHRLKTAIKCGQREQAVLLDAERDVILARIASARADHHALTRGYMPPYSADYPELIDA